MLGVTRLTSALAAQIQSRVQSRLRDWSVESQARARRNALVETTACAQRRVEREDVMHYLDERARRRAGQLNEHPTTRRAVR